MQNIRDAYVRHAKLTSQYGTFDSTDAGRLSTSDFNKIMEEYIKLQIEAENEASLGEMAAIAIPSAILIVGSIIYSFLF